MITSQQVKERLKDEKDPLQYLDGEIARCADLMGHHCGKVQETISIYKNRANTNDQFDLQKVKDDLMMIGEAYGEISTFLKIRKELVKQQKRSEHLNKELVKHQKWIDQKRAGKDDSAID
jgi:hypothetical protein